MSYSDNCAKEAEDSYMRQFTYTSISKKENTFKACLIQVPLILKYFVTSYLSHNIGKEEHTVLCTYIANQISSHAMQCSYLISQFKFSNTFLTFVSMPERFLNV